VIGVAVPAGGVPLHAQPSKIQPIPAHKPCLRISLDQLPL
jgi:hypothetical protein